MCFDRHHNHWYRTWHSLNRADVIRPNPAYIHVHVCSNLQKQSTGLRTSYDYDTNQSL